MLVSCDYLEILGMNFQYFMLRKREHIMMRRDEENIDKCLWKWVGKKAINQQNKLVSLGENGKWRSQAELDIAQDGNGFFTHL